MSRIDGAAGCSGHAPFERFSGTVITMGTGTEPEQVTGFDPEEYPGELSTGSKQNGNDAEAWVIDQYDLEPRDTDICPEHAHDAVDPRTGTPIEIKSCQIRYNSHGSRGRFQIWDYAHETLLEHGGGYIFVVHEPRTDHFHVYLHRPLSAAQVDELIGNWHPIDHTLRPDEAHRTEVSQSAVFSDIQITRIDPSETEQNDSERTDADADPPQMERMKAAKDAVKDIEEQRDDQMAPHGAVVQQAVAESGATPDQIEHQLEELKKRGEIYMPQKGAYRVT